MKRGSMVWLLLLLPLAPLAGWLIGEMPVPPPPAPVVTTAAPPADPTAAPSPSPGTRAAAERVVEATRAAVQTAEEPAPERSRWTTIDDAVAESRRNGKPVLIDFNAEWCGPCQRMKQEVFDDGTRGQAVEVAVIPVSIVDRTREDGSNPPETESLQSRHQVRAFPTLVVFSPSTGRSMRTQGFGDADQTLAWITEAARSVR